MRIIYNEDLNKRIIPYVDKLIKNKKKLDKETAVLFDVFIQYLDMDTRYGTYGEQLEPCITEIIREESIRNVAHLFDGKLNKLLLYLLGASKPACSLYTLSGVLPAGLYSSKSHDCMPNNRAAHATNIYFLPYFIIVISFLSVRNQDSNQI